MFWRDKVFTVQWHYLDDRHQPAIACVYEGRSEKQAKEAFHASTDFILGRCQTAEVSGRLTFSEGLPGGYPHVTRYIQWEKGQMADTAGTGLDPTRWS